MSNPEWTPDWFPGAANRGAIEDTDTRSSSPTVGEAVAPERTTGTSRPESLKTTQQTISMAHGISKEWRTEPTKTIVELVREDRSVNRRLRGIHLFVSISKQDAIS